MANKGLKNQKHNQAHHLNIQINIQTTQQRSLKRVVRLFLGQVTLNRVILNQVTLSSLLLLTCPSLVLAQSLPPRAQPQPASVTQPPLAEPIDAGDGYILGAGDRIRLDIFNVPEYSGEYQVLSDGTLNLPLVGTVPVQGMTLQQASQQLSTRFAPILRRPIVTLSLLQARPITIAVAGEINRPGSYTVSPDGSSNPTLTQALQLAGGVTQAADIGQIQVRRLRARGVEANQVLNVDLWQLVRAGDLNQDLSLRDGDTILIPTRTNTNLAEARQLAATTFAANETNPIQIAVVGQVNRPGPYTLRVQSEGQAGGVNSLQVPTVTQAIQVAGGITQSANIRGIEVRRPTNVGQEQVIKVDFWELLRAGDLNQDLPLQEGDTIYIPTATTLDASEATELASTSFSPSTMTVNVVGEVARPGVVEVPPNTPLNQALLTAGGFNNRAARGSVELVRLNPDGTVSRREISVNFAQGVDAEDNPALRNNDTIIVGRSSLAGASDILGTVLSPITGVFSLFRLLGF